jgi:periplasmic protein TonB
MTRRSIVAAISIFLHAIVLVALMTADLWRPISEWPAPRSAMAFEAPPRAVHVEDIPAAKSSPERSDHSPGLEPISRGNLAPVVPPSNLVGETGAEQPLSGSVGVAGVEANATGVGSISTPVDPPPPPAPQAPIRLHSGIRAPQRLVDVRPIYPAIAHSAHVQGVVIIEATIDEHGDVIRAQVLRSIPLLDGAALGAVRQWRFSPTLLNGVAVPIVMTVTVNFTLTDR